MHRAFRCAAEITPDDTFASAEPNECREQDGCGAALDDWAPTIGALHERLQDESMRGTVATLSDPLLAAAAPLCFVASILRVSWMVRYDPVEISRARDVHVPSSHSHADESFKLA
jgi:hypothetical protein